MHDGAPRWSRRNRTIVFPSTVRTVHPGSFNLLESLRAALMNEGLETLGTYKYDWSAAEPSDTAGSEKCACPQRFEGSKKTPSWAANNSQILYYQKDYSHWELVFLRERTGECTFPVNAENDRKKCTLGVHASEDCRVYRGPRDDTDERLPRERDRARRAPPPYEWCPRRPSRCVAVSDK